MEKRDTLYSFWNAWLDMKKSIEDAYKQKDSRAADLMEKAIENYIRMVESFLHANPSVPGDIKLSIEPLNGEERLQFIRSKISGYFAYVQLDALYTEAMKKAVSQLAMKK
jgi:hypothetical protein